VSSPLTRALVLALAAALSVGCLDPLDDDTDAQGAPSAPLGSEMPDPAAALLAEEVDELVALLTDTGEQLQTAAEAGDLGSAQAAAARAEERLIGDPEEGGTVLFPVEDLDRGELSDREDLLTRTLTAAREAGGDDGRDVTEGVRDLLAGDLGGWQRDPDGMVAMADDAAVPRDSLEEVERAVFELPGGGTQALAYILLISRTGSLERAHAYAERAAAHLEVARSGLADLDLGDDTADDGADA
jgi:hypothetical protein